MSALDKPSRFDYDKDEVTESSTGHYRWDRDACKVVKVSDRPSRGGIPDVFFKEPYFDHHLGDAKNPFGQHITSKTHKAQVMKAQGVFEHGDRIRGGR